jgi:hypothetical protein
MSDEKTKDRSTKIEKIKQENRELRLKEQN